MVKNDGNWEEKKDDSKRNKSIWEIDDDCVIESRQTVIGANAFDVIMSYTEFPKPQKQEELKFSKVNTIYNNINKKSSNENKIQKNNENKDDEEQVILNRPRSHAFFVPASVCQKQIKENNHLYEETVKKEEDKSNEIKEEKEENEENEEMKEEENIKENQEIKEEKEEKEEKENIKAKQEIQIREAYIDKENKIKSFKYAKFVGINRYRNKTNSIVNKMMINSFKNSKNNLKYEIGIK